MITTDQYRYKTRLPKYLRRWFPHSLSITLKSTTFYVTNTIGKALNEGTFCIGLFLDLRNAFDVCSHELLLMNLKKLGVTGTALKWFKSYLNNRSQQVDINGNISTPQHINISVLQGSILGPIL